MPSSATPIAVPTTGVSEELTPGVLNALNRNRSRTTCKECGFPLPIYPGRYPSRCPHCETEFTLEGGNADKDAE